MITSTITRRAAVLLQDVAHTRWPLDELLAYLTDAVRTLCVYKPDACSKLTTHTLVAGTKQTLPPDGVTLVDVVRNSTSGRTVRRVDRSVLDAANTNWHNATPAVDVTHYVFDPQNQTTFWVDPPNTGAGALELVYAAVPSELSDGDSIAVSDVWVPALLDYVLYRCYSKDAEYAGNAQAAIAYYNAFAGQVAAKTAGELGTDVNGNK